MPASSAACFTGPGSSFRPRPAGRSGWLYTPTTLYLAASRAFRAVAAKSGVPAKTIRTVFGSLLSSLLDFSSNSQSDSLIHPIRKDRAQRPGHQFYGCCGTNTTLINAGSGTRFKRSSSATFPASCGCGYALANSSNPQTICRSGDPSRAGCTPPTARELLFQKLRHCDPER